MATERISVNESYTVYIPFATLATSSTITFSVYKASSGASFTSGTLTFVVGKTWKMSFTPTTVDETYLLECLDADGDIVHSSQYKGVTSVASETEDTNITISKTSIANKALSRIGAEQISSITDGTANADIMNLLYQTSLKALLSECQWNFAIKRAALTSSASISLSFSFSGEAYQYEKPTDIVRILEVSDQYATWRDEGSYIISDTAGLGLKYIYFDDDPSNYPASFIDAFIDRLAYEAAYMILNSASMAERLLEKYNKLSLPKAKSENAQVGTHQVVNDDAWELAKYNNTNPRA